MTTPVYNRTGLWLVLWIFVAVCVGAALLGLLLASPSKTFSANLVALYSSALMFLPTVLIFVFVSPENPPQATDWVVLGINTAAAAWLLGVSAYGASRNPREVVREDREQRAREIGAGMIGGRITPCDYFCLGLWFVGYVGFITSGWIVISPTTDVPDQIVWCLGVLLCVALFAGYTFRIARVGMHRRNGAAALCCAYGFLVLVAILVAVVVPFSPAVIFAETLFILVCALVLLAALSRCCLVVYERYAQRHDAVIADGVGEWE